MVCQSCMSLHRVGLGKPTPICPCGKSDVQLLTEKGYLICTEEILDRA